MELFQRIEQLIAKKLPLYPTVEEEVMLLMERVTEAQRFAKMVRERGNLPLGFSLSADPLSPSDVSVFRRKHM